MTPASRPLPEQNAKGELLAACRSLGLPDPSFESESGGPGHAPWFRCTVTVSGAGSGTGEGKSRREAERLASLEALKALGLGDEGAPLSPAPTLVQPPISRWPIYADVLSQALLVAHERSEVGTLPQVAQDAALLYRRLLGELGHAPETE